MNRKIMANVLIATMGIACLTGCGQKSQDQTSAAQNVSQNGGEEKEVLTVWVRDTTAAAAIAAAENYNKIQDKVTVNVVQQVNKEIANQFTLALSANEAPDVISLDCTKIPYYAANGAFVDISDRFDALDFKDQFSAGMVKSGQVDGKTYAVPFSPDVSVLLYNKEHYREAGLDTETPPTTWDELIDYSQKLTKDGRYGYVYAGAHSGAYMFTFMPYVWNNGGQFLSEDGKTCSVK